MTAKEPGLAVLRYMPASLYGTARVLAGFGSAAAWPGGVSSLKRVEESRQLFTGENTNADRPHILEQHLTMAERHVAQGGRHVARQRELLAKLERDGHGTFQSRNVWFNSRNCKPCKLPTATVSDESLGLPDTLRFDQPGTNSSNYPFPLRVNKRNAS